MDLEIRQMRESIINVLNSFDIPVEVKRLAVKEIYNELAARSDEVIRIQQAELIKNEGVDNDKQISQ